MSAGFVVCALSNTDDAPSPCRIRAVAISELGAPYSWHATGPSELDCSGLMVWSYAREGKAPPRSSQADAMPVSGIRRY